MTATSAAAPALAVDRTGSGLPLVLLHPLGADRRVWAPLIPLLAGERELIAVDLPGFGESAPLPNGDEPTPERFAESVIGLFDQLGLDRPVVAGNSLGGWVSLEIARRGRARAAGPVDPAGFGLPRERLYATRRLRIEVTGARFAVPNLLPFVRNPLTRTPFFAPMIARPWRLSPDEAEGSVRNLARSPGFDATLEMLSRSTFRGATRSPCRSR